VKQAHPNLLTENGSTQSTQKDSSTGQLTATTDPKGATTQYQYSQSGTGYFSQQTDPAGRVTTYTRDANQNLLVETYPDGSNQTYTRDNFGLVLTSKDELNRTTTYTRDANHRVIATTYPDGTTESVTYNTFGQVLTNIRRDGTSTSNTYDSTGRKIASTDPLGKVTSYSYDAADRLASVTDALGHTTRYSYNLRGQITQTTYADTTTRSASYDLYGSLSSSTDELGHTSLNTYDWYKRILTHADALGRTTVYNYGIPGVGMGGGCGCSHIENFPTTITSPAGRVTYFTYDLKWQKTSVTIGYGTPAASTTSYAYDVLDRIISTTDGLGHAWTTTFDLRNRKLTETNPLNQVTGFTYDLAGNLLTTTLPDGRVTANTYDTVNRMVTTKDPKNQIMSYGYDAMGRITTLTDTKNNVTHWFYDARGGLTGKTYANGLLKSIDNGSAKSDYSYDVANELTSETQTLSGQAAKVVSYTYDPDGNRATTTYPSGKLVELAWTPRNQLASVTYDGPPPIANYAYDLGGRLSSISHENGIVETKSYDNANRLLSNIHSHAGSATGGDTYTLDTTGRRTAETFADGTTPARSYGYDPTDQVTAADYGAGQTDAYAYDPMGNRTAVTLAKDSGATTSYTTNTANQYTAISAQAAPTFDANGNILTQNGVNYTWDSESPPQSVPYQNDSKSGMYDSKGGMHDSKGGLVEQTGETRYNNLWNVYLEGTDASGTLAGNNNASGYNFNTMGVTVGADRRMNDNFVFGVLGSYNSLNSDLYNHGSVEGDSYKGAVYATLFKNGFFLDALMGAGYNSYNTHRSSVGGYAEGNPDGWELDSLINGGYDIHKGNWTITPMASLAYTRVTMNSFTETGSMSPLTFPTQNQDSLRTDLGVEISYSAVMNNGMVITPQARLSWQHEFLDSTQSINSSFVSTPGSAFTVNGPEINRDRAMISAGFNVLITPNVSAYANYDSQLGNSNYNYNSVTVGVNVAF
jgi:outer membrane autotransporter protein